MRVKTATITTNYELSGPKTAPAVMLSHALGCNLHLWGPQLTALEGRFRVLCYDTRGHGGSDAPEGAYTLDQLVADALGLLDALAIERVHFVGLSMGGMIAQGFALSHPERLNRLVLCDTSAFMPPVAQQIIQESEREMVYLGGGAGMAPLRSHISNLLETQHSIRRISYWYGARSKMEIFYQDYFKELARRHENFCFHVALSAPLPEDAWD